MKRRGRSNFNSNFRSKMREEDSHGTIRGEKKSRLSSIIVHESIAKIKNENELQEHIGILLGCYPESAYEYDLMGFLPLHIACIHHAKNKNIISSIIAANPNAIFEKPQRIARKYAGQYPIHIALNHGATVEVLDLLLGENLETILFLDKKEQSLLQIALRNRTKPHIVHYLISRDESLVHVPDLRLNFPLHTACRYFADEDIIETLLILSPEVLYARNRDGQTPVDLSNLNENSSDEVMNIINNFFDENGS